MKQTNNRSQAGRGRFIFASLCGGVLAFAVSIILTMIASVYICLGMHPESLSAIDMGTPLLGLMCGGVWAGKMYGRRTWSIGAAAALLNVVLWFAAELYLLGRFSPHLWLHEALPGIGFTHLMYWTAAIIAGSMGGILGPAMNKAAPWKLGVSLALVPLLLMMIMLIRNASAGAAIDGVTYKYTAPDASGTTVRLFTFDFQKNPNLRIGLFDADSADSSPGNDKNTTYLGTPVGAALKKLQSGQPSKDRVLCMFNAGFFGWDNKYIGFHVAPITVDGKLLYNVSGFSRDMWTLGVSREKRRVRLDLKQGLTWKDMSDKYETAIAHVRPLIIAGKAPVLRLGAGVTRLKCSRTSIAWSSDGSKLYLLLVRDPDGEMAGVRQMKSGKAQTGGWDLVDLQQFWHKLGVDNAVALDGGDSTQLMYLNINGRCNVVTSGYISSRTVGYLRGRPVRLFIPMLPPEQSHGGVMNYLYLYESAKVK